jgi:hypothetical protein
MTTSEREALDALAATEPPAAAEGPAAPQTMEPAAPPTTVRPRGPSATQRMMAGYVARIAQLEGEVAHLHAENERLHNAAPQRGTNVVSTLPTLGVAGAAGECPDCDWEGRIPPHGKCPACNVAALAEAARNRYAANGKGERWQDWRASRRF